MNPRIERVREDIRRTEGKIKELDEYLKSLRIREKQLCDEELIKVMRSMAGKDGDVIALLDSFQKKHERSMAIVGRPEAEKKAAEQKSDVNGASAVMAKSQADSGSEHNENGGR